MDRAELESIVNDKDAPYFEKGRALDQLLTNNGWRRTHSGPDKYCREKFGISAKRAYRLIEAAKAYWLLRANQTIATKLPASEEQIRPLATVPEDQQVSVWGYILRTAPDGKLNQAYIQSVCEQFAWTI